MKKTPILSDEQILNLWDTHVGEPCSSMPLVGSDKEAFARAIEQAVLQSPQVQQWRKEAERYQWLRNECNEYEVFEALFEEPPHRWDDKVDALREKTT